MYHVRRAAPPYVPDHAGVACGIAGILSPQQPHKIPVLLQPQRSRFSGWRLAIAVIKSVQEFENCTVTAFPAAWLSFSLANCCVKNIVQIETHLHFCFSFFLFDWRFLCNSSLPPLILLFVISITTLFPSSSQGLPPEDNRPLNSLVVIPTVVLGQQWMWLRNVSFGIISCWVTSAASIPSMNFDSVVALE